ncbi:MAG: histidine kinase [Lachnospiraceae bacterium]|nr:histidine kinase [Lachnospiraceae bacterium]
MNKKTKPSFLEQLKNAFILIILIPVLLFGGFIFYNSYRYVKDQRLIASTNSIEQNLIDLNNRIEQCQNSIKYLAANYSLQEFLQMDSSDTLELNKKAQNASVLIYNVLLSNQYYKKLTLYTEEDVLVLSDLQKSVDSVSDQQWFQDILLTSNVCWWFDDGTLYMGRKIVATYYADTLGVVVAELKSGILENSFSLFENYPIRINIYDEDILVYEYENGTFAETGFEQWEELEGTGFSIQYLIDKSYYGSIFSRNLCYTMIFVFVVFILAWLSIQVVARKLSKDLSVLVDEVNEVQNGNFDVPFQDTNTEEARILSESIQSMVNRIKKLIRQVYTKEIERQDLELNLLQSKISPHFLYNNLSAINWLALDCGEERISEITTEMATFYRTALNKGNNIDRLSVELENIQSYVKLQLIAHEDAFSVEYDVDESLKTCIIPIFILQPLVENAIEHGIERMTEKRGNIIIRIYQQDATLYLVVHDNGDSLYEKIGAAALPVENYGYGTGNVHKRIQLLYGKECGLTVLADETGTTSQIRLIADHLKL